MTSPVTLNRHTAGDRLFIAALILLCTTTGASAQTALRFDVRASGMRFTPGEIRVVTGDSVRWKFSGAHTSTSGTCSGADCTPDGLWDSGTQRSGSFTQRFDTAGDYPYFCEIHGAMMQGVVHVQAAPAPTDSTLLVTVTQRGSAKLNLLGANFGSGAVVEIDGVPAPQSVRRSDRALIAKGSALRQMLPVGTAVQITVRNADGKLSEAITFTRQAGSGGSDYGGY